MQGQNKGHSPTAIKYVLPTLFKRGIIALGFPYILPTKIKNSDF